MTALSTSTGPPATIAGTPQVRAAGQTTAAEPSGSWLFANLLSDPQIAASGPTTANPGTGSEPASAPSGGTAKTARSDRRPSPRFRRATPETTPADTETGANPPVVATNAQPLTSHTSEPLSRPTLPGATRAASLASTQLKDPTAMVQGGTDGPATPSAPSHRPEDRSISGDAVIAASAPEPARGGVVWVHATTGLAEVAAGNPQMATAPAIPDTAAPEQKRAMAAPPTLGHPTNAAPAPSPAQQVTPALLVTVAKGIGERVTVALKPEELGSVEIRIERPATGPATVTLSVERSDTLALLQQSRGELTAALDRAGLPENDRIVSLAITPTSSVSGDAAPYRQDQAQNPSPPAGGFDGSGSFGQTGGGQREGGKRPPSGYGADSDEGNAASVAGLFGLVSFGIDITA